MSVKMIDITSKEPVYREAIATGFLRVDEDTMGELMKTGVSGLGNAAAIAKVTAINATKTAWKYIPLLHPVPITYIEAKVRYEKNGIRMAVLARTKAQTGVEMDALFGLFTGLLAAWNTIKGCSRTCTPEWVTNFMGKQVQTCGSSRVDGMFDIKVVSKVKSEDGVSLSLSDFEDNTGGSPVVTMFDVTTEPTYYGEASARGFIKLREGTIELIRQGKVEKGDVVTVAKTASIMATKRTWEVLPLVHLNYITYVNTDVKVVEDGVEITVDTRNVSNTGSAMEAVFAVGVGLLTVWDMVKKYEKDENGQYPYTVIREVKVLKALKTPAV
ncbi:cyclic pyranopterin monophosphate synthase MoaC [Vulcanisaeta distributa]|uniref:Molybdopterin cofactor biosynthesis-containing protein MoaC region n=1 Tax=Vulcanisaeta distributa (strain DSM 14429 / JCM 11212 / NBRC 100878 / IC-017) TaxID=572478 RepID=E1QSY5_VULDI|nr:cyclic pyranopterin monophosphate synthase MoaC [Vulcanisaeta distributa]ADN50852.1 molybdopterin cofactor biosynthesis-containing protein MoaC region [Vulcanisaeta distributa DSM 14429]